MFIFLFKHSCFNLIDETNLPMASVSQAFWKLLHSVDSPSSAPSVKHLSSPLLENGHV